MSLNRRQFLKNASIGTVGIVGATSMLKTNSAFASYPCSGTSDISFVGGDSTYTGGRKQMIKDVVDPFKPVIAAAITAGKKIVLKPNCVANKVLAATHVDALAGLIEVIRSIDSTVPIIIAEASATTTTTVYTTAKYNTLNTTYGNITLVDLNTDKTNYPPVIRHIWKSDLKSKLNIYVAPIFVDPSYFIISCTKPKTHNKVVLTGVTKNMSMGMPLTSAPSSQTVDTGTSTNSKEMMHCGQSNGQRQGEDKVLAHNIFQNACQYVLAGHPGLAVLDDWEGMEGEGPSDGTSVPQYCAVASTDFVAVDRCCAKLAGLSDTAILDQVDPPTTPSFTDMRALCFLNNARIGNFDLNKINFVKGTMDDLVAHIKKYKMHSYYTATQAWETLWLGDTTWGPDSVLDSQGVTPKVRNSYKDVGVLGGNGTPYMHPQANIHANGLVTSNRIKIDLFMPGNYNVRLSIYDIKGREIKKLGHEFLNGGRYSIEWDCRDNHGSRVPNGKYLIRLDYDGGQLCDDITLMR